MISGTKAEQSIVDAYKTDVYQVLEGSNKL
jgi:hypothetical protein